MTKRYTILCAALINAALLLILFFSARVDQEAPKKPAATNFTLNEAPSAFADTDQAQLPVTESETVEVDFDSNQTAYKISNPTEKEPLTVPNYEEITIQRGDRLEKLAKSHGTTVEDLVLINNLNSTQLVIGKKLRVPSSKTNAESISEIASAIETPSEGEEAIRYHYVQKGESPWKIAKKYQTSVKTLLELNNLDEQSARRLREGDRLRVR